MLVSKLHVTAGAMAVAVLMLTSCSGDSFNERLDGALRFISISRTLPADEMATLYRPGRAFDVTWANGREMELMLEDDQVARLSDDSGVASGSWAIKSNSFCLAFPALDEECFASHRDGEAGYRLYDSKGIFAATLKAG